MTRLGPDGKPSTSKHLCNVIDTPGHVDFASEVSTASRLCDGALVLVDVVEGVCTQTIAVLRQAWIDRLRPLLVINKMDRLITELKLSPSEAYHHLSQLIEQVNAVMGSFYASERMEDDLRWREERERRLALRRDEQADVPAGSTPGGSAPGSGTNTPTPAEDDGGEYEEKEDEDIYFAPERGNVLFASAIDGWAFRLGKFARLYADKLGIKEANLRRVLWGDWYLDPKSKRVVGRKKLAGRPLKPMFVQFVLDNLWRVYDTVLGDYNPDAVQKIVTAQSIKISPRDLKSKDTRNLLTLIMQQWLPLSTTTFQAVIDVIPSPTDAQALRLAHMLHPEEARASSTPLQPANDLEKALFSCDQAEGVQVTAYVSKMFAVKRGDLPQYRPKELSAEEMRQRGREERERRAAALAASQATPDGASPSATETNSGKPLTTDDLSKPLESLTLDANVGAHGAETTAVDSEPSSEPESSEILLGFSRIFSGVLKRDTPLLATLPKFDPDLAPTHARNTKYVTRVTARDLYMMMGRELVAVEEVPAGHVCAIGGLEGKVFRNATLWAPDAAGIKSEEIPKTMINLAGVSMQAAPIVRVALEPENPSDMPKLVRGLQILNQADPCAEYLVQETGEHVILTAGELHLERCLKDLRERFAKCAIQQSETIVPFRETAVRAPDMAPPKTKGAPRGTVHGTLLDGLVGFTIRAVPIPSAITDFLLAHPTSIASLISQRGSTVDESEEAAREERETAESAVTEARVLSPQEFWAELETICAACGGEWVGAADRVWCFGPKRMGANLLLDPVGKTSLRLRGKEQLIASARARGQTADEALASTDDAVAQDQLASLDSSAAKSESDTRAELRLLRDFENSVEAGFQMATFQGPLCAEPTVGMGWVVERIEHSKDEEEGKGRTAVVGALISAVRDACRAGMLDWSPRIKLAMYTCDIQASTDVLGKVYAVVARRRGRIVSEEMKEGTAFFTIRAMLPVVESFGFADEIRKRTSGAASPQLIFSGFETLDLDPFWVPTTVEELEDLGEKADRANVAKAYVDGVRKRKGMFVERKIVESAEKQRTLKR
ncbi:Cytoplasmic GTPase/eEF2-like protein (ribosomal bioproteinsis) [Saitozyma podzolica]|uniref:Elongation factor-like 1 n=1 Tax=Saitozyma podzolica TaxID=1890683 RepID=A0A427XRT1_9TREE|nr:Cytoplasmic GTPase/eEF2-like protein (ribosomal bioproteinsis) [Saitozyma podzolica]